MKKIIIRSLHYLPLIFIILTACSGGQKDLQDTAESREPGWTKNLVLYELNVRQFSKEGTFKAVESKVGELADLGVDVIWFMPIHPIGEINRKGPLGSYYSVKDFKDVNPEFGNLKDFKSLVKTIHDAGMYVMMDWVPNHSSWDNELAEKHPDWYYHDSTGTFISPYDWTDVIQFDWSNEDLQEYMLEALIYWVKDIGIDGYRVDHPHVTPADFWMRARAKMEEIKPVIMLAENEDRVEFFENGFDMNYSWELHHMMNQVAQGKRKYTAMDTLLMKDFETFPRNAYRLRFITNHDENSWAGTIDERMGDAHKAFAVFMYTIPGVPLIYNGQEAGLNKRLKFFERDPIEWRESELREFYKTLNTLKHNNPAIYNGIYGGSFNQMMAFGAENVFAYYRFTGDNKLVTCINFSDKPESFHISATLHGDFRNVFTGDTVLISGSTDFELGPWEYVVLSTR